MNGFLAQQRGDLFGLAQPDIAQVAVARTLAAVLQIPIGSAVAHKTICTLGYRERLSSLLRNRY